MSFLQILTIVAERFSIHLYLQNSLSDYFNILFQLTIAKKTGIALGITFLKSCQQVKNIFVQMILKTIV